MGPLVPMPPAVVFGGGPSNKVPRSLAALLRRTIPAVEFTVGKTRRGEYIGRRYGKGFAKPMQHARDTLGKVTNGRGQG